MRLATLATNFARLTGRLEADFANVLNGNTPRTQALAAAGSDVSMLPTSMPQASNHRSMEYVRTAPNVGQHLLEQ